jgi:cell division inhibitor SepF
MVLKKRKEVKEIGTSFERLKYYTFVDHKAIDEQFIELADILLGDRAIVTNFEEIHNLDDVNRAVAFLSGVCYALEGTVQNIGNETFVFATKKSLADGTIEHYIDDVAKDPVNKDE